MLDKDDILVLDSFIDILLSKKGEALYLSSFERLQYFSDLPTISDIDYEFERLARIIDEHKAAKVFNLEANSTSRPVLRTNYNTSSFKSKGGFKAIFDKQKLEESRKAKKENREHLLTGWKYYTFWPLFVLAIFGGGYSLYDFKERLSKEENFQLSQNPKVEKGLEQSKQHILPLTQKNQDSSFQTNSDKETSIRKID